MGGKTFQIEKLSFIHAPRVPARRSWVLESVCREDDFDAKFQASLHIQINPPLTNFGNPHPEEEVYEEQIHVLKSFE
jgi:hypothetical protein